MEEVLSDIIKLLAGNVPVWHIEPDVFGKLNEAITKAGKHGFFRLEAPISIGSGLRFNSEVGFRCNAYTRIGENAEIGEGVIIGGHVSIGNNVTIGRYSQIGDYACICDNAVIGDNVTIGCKSIICTNASIGEKVKIGNNVTVGNGSKVGTNTDIRDACCILDNVVIGERCCIFCHSTLEDFTELKGDNMISANSVICYKSILDFRIALSHGCVVPAKTFLKQNDLPELPVRYDWGTYYTNGTYFGNYCYNFREFQNARHGRC